jgi:hypothetical protein
LQSLYVRLLSDFVLLGDFNVNFLAASHPCSHLCNITHSFSLTQCVSEATHTIPTGSSSCVVIPHSDHRGIQISISISGKNPLTTVPRKIWLYNQAHFELANNLLDTIDWTKVLTGDINNALEMYISWSYGHMHPTENAH